MQRLTHLDRLEAESIHIMREVVAEADNPVMLYSVGKDSAVMLHLARKAFHPAPPPFPLLHVDTTWKFRDMYVLRDKAAKALKAMIADAEIRKSQGREIVIFPEGTRQAPGAPPDYKPGYIALYEALDLPCVPLALNSGLFWPRRSLMRYPGTIVVEFLDPIPPGLPRKEFRAILEHRLEAAAQRLVEEGRNELGS